MDAASHVPHLPEALGGLAELALDLRWSSDFRAEEFWRQIAPEVWAVTRNPWLILQTASRRRLEELEADADFRRELEVRLRERRATLAAPGWFRTAHSRSALGSVAYFSLEFGLSEALPIYSGGLGLLAGDHLKAASDLGVPLVGIGLLYQQGYFRQVIDAGGSQCELYPYNDPSQLPVLPVRDADGGWLRMPFEPPGRTLWLRVWEARVGRVKLYLLDSNDPLNSAADRGITAELYGGGSELRFQQEAVLALGGFALLRALGIQPEIFHLNEGHAALVVLARAAAFAEEHAVSLDVALAATRPGNLFTTHTPVAAGFDRFDPALVGRYLTRFAEQAGTSLERILALGRANPADRHEPFNMAWLAVRGSGAVNAVSRLHEQVSRRVLQPLFPRWPEVEVPVGHVTNGVHVPSWEAPQIGAALEETCGPERWIDDPDAVQARIQALGDERLWEIRNGQRRDLVDFVRLALERQRGVAGEPEERRVAARRALDPRVLTLGFARRFAPYKRPNLLLHDPERLVRLLTHAERPVQLVVAGKAHPQDGAGKSMIRAWSEFLARHDVAGRAVFVADYDMLVAERLVQGVDVWINNPLRPWEASGTSGMKVLVNGGLNLSELDGWWAEAFAPGLGWALGDGREHEGDPGWDAFEAGELLRVLEQEVVPEFYDRDELGIPRRWLARVRESMASLTPRFSSQRMLREYVERFYLPLAAVVRRRAADQAKAAAAIVGWRAVLAEHWGSLRLGEVHSTTAAGEHRFEAQLHLGQLEAEDVRVELFAEGRSGEGPRRREMARQLRLSGDANAFLYAGSVPDTRPRDHWTVRVVPQHPEALIPLEAEPILWQNR